MEDIAQEWHARTLMSRAFSQWRGRWQMGMSQRIETSIAVEHWKSQMLHASWMRWVRAIGESRRVNIALSHWSIRLRAQVFYGWNEWRQARCRARIGRSRSLAFWSEKLLAKCFSSWRFYATANLVEEVSSAADCLSVSCPSLPGPLSNTEHSKLALATKHGRHHHQKLQRLWQPGLSLPPIVPRTPIRRNVKSPLTSAASTSLSSSPGRSISRRSLMAYHHAASRLLSRMLLGWRNVALRSDMLSINRVNTGDNKRRRVILRSCFALLHKNALAERRAEHCERLARRNNYFRLHKAVFLAWASIVVSKKQRFRHFVYVRSPLLKLAHCFKLWESLIEPRLHAKNKGSAERQDLQRLRRIGIHRWFAFTRKMAYSRSTLASAKSHYRSSICQRAIRALRLQVLRATVARDCALKMQAKRLQALLRSSFDNWDAWTSSSLMHRDSCSRADEHYCFHLASVHFQKWASWTQAKMELVLKNRLARDHWAYVTKEAYYDVWARVWQVGKNAQAMQHSVARAHWRVKTVKKYFDVWSKCRILGPIRRRMHERRLIRRVARYAEHWRSFAMKKSVLRLCHEGYDDKFNRTQNCNPSKSKSSRTRPRCNSDLLRLSVTSSEEKPWLQSFNDLTVADAANLVAEFSQLCGPQDMKTPDTVRANRRMHQRIDSSKLHPKTVDIFASLTSVQDNLLALSQQKLLEQQLVVGGRAVPSPIRDTSVRSNDNYDFLVHNKNDLDVIKSTPDQTKAILAHIRELRMAVEGTLGRYTRMNLEDSQLSMIPVHIP